jgi:hypothetical protein
MQVVITFTKEASLRKLRGEEVPDIGHFLNEVDDLVGVTIGTSGHVVEAELKSITIEQLQAQLDPNLCVQRAKQIKPFCAIG